MPSGAPLSAEALFADDGQWRHPAASAGQVVDGTCVTLPAEGVSLEAVERALICAALSTAGGNQTQAAKLLKVPRHVLLYRVEKYGITDSEVKSLGGGRTARVMSTPSSS